MRIEKHYILYTYIDFFPLHGMLLMTFYRTDYHVKKSVVYQNCIQVEFKAILIIYFYLYILKTIVFDI